MGTAPKGRTQDPTPKRPSYHQIGSCRIGRTSLTAPVGDLRPLAHEAVMGTEEHRRGLTFLTSQERKMHRGPLPSWQKAIPRIADTGATGSKPSKGGLEGFMSRARIAPVQAGTLPY